MYIIKGVFQNENYISRHCRRSTKEGGTTARGGTTLEVGETIYFVDVGAPIADLIANRDDIEYERIKALFITHPHNDHDGGLPMFLSLEKWHYPDSKTQCYLPDKLIYNAVEPILAGSPDDSDTNVKIHLFDEGKFYDDGVLTVEAIPNDHLKHVGIQCTDLKLRQRAKNFYLPEI